MRSAYWVFEVSIQWREDKSDYVRRKGNVFYGYEIFSYGRYKIFEVTASNDLKQTWTSILYSVSICCKWWKEWNIQYCFYTVLVG